MLAADLVLRDNELDAVAVVRVGDRVLEEADRAHDLALEEDLVFARALAARLDKVARVADDLLRLDRLAAALDADKLALVVVNDLLDRLVEHVRAAVDGGQAREALRQLAQAVQRVNVRRLAVPRHRGRV